MTDHVTDTNVGKMTPQEASEILETDISNIGIMRDGYTKGVSHDAYNEAVGIAREALQKQIPIPPEEKVRPEYASLGKNYYCRCGVMFNEWMNEFRRTNYCGNCGQRLLERGDAD